MSIVAATLSVSHPHVPLHAAHAVRAVVLSTIAGCHPICATSHSGSLTDDASHSWPRGASGIMNAYCHVPLADSSSASFMIHELTAFCLLPSILGAHDGSTNAYCHVPLAEGFVDPFLLLMSRIAGCHPPLIQSTISS
jgi:hypothetical protein